MLAAITATPGVLVSSPASADTALAGFAQEVLAEVLSLATILESDPEALELAWVKPFWRQERGREEMVRGHQTSQEPGWQDMKPPGPGRIPEPGWKAGQREAVSKGEADWKTHEWKDNPGSVPRKPDEEPEPAHKPDSESAAPRPVPAPPPPKGAAAVHPQMGHFPNYRGAGDTISGHAYAHLPPLTWPEPEPLEKPEYQLPDHEGSLTPDEVNDRIAHVEEQVSAALFAGHDTAALHSMAAPHLAGGRIWSAERADQHNQIVNSLMARAKDVPSEGKAVVAGGLPGAGKSTVLSQLPGKYLHVDADEIKGEMAKRGMIPAVGDLAPLEAAPLVHEESRYIAALLAARAMEDRKNLIIDGTMAGPRTPLRYLKDLRAAGYPDIRALFVHTDPETAIARTESRYRQGLEAWRAGKNPEGGRYLPAGAVKGNASGARGIFDSIKGSFDAHQLWDTSSGSPVLHADYSGQLSDADYLAHAGKVEDALARALSRSQSTDYTQTLDGKGGYGQIWKPDRASLHNEIVNRYLGEAHRIPAQGKAVISGGLGGAGRAVVKAAGISGRDYLRVSLDEIKREMADRGMIPTVEGLSPMEASVLVHEEASHIQQLIADQLHAAKRNILWDTTMASHAALAERLGELRDAGYTSIGGVFAHASAEEGAARARARHREGLEAWRKGQGYGERFTPPGLVRMTDRGHGDTRNHQIYNGLKPEFGWWKTFDASGAQPRLAESSAQPHEGDLVRQLEQGTIDRYGNPVTPPGQQPYTGATEAEARAAEKGTQP